MGKLLQSALAVLGLFGALVVWSTYSVDGTIARARFFPGIPGVSLAVLDRGAIVKVRAYGVIERGLSARVTPDTLFQAGSISKPVSAAGALRLVEMGKLELDADINTALKRWQMPQNEFTRIEKVTLRRLLSHTAGLTVHGFPGYAPDAPRPSLVQVLDGLKPANTEAVRVTAPPGNGWRYSGGGYTVAQLAMEDATGEPFPALMQRLVLEPLGLRDSTFEQPLPIARGAMTATGHYMPRTPVPGRWHVYPEMAAAGLWTTASDLARFAGKIQDSRAGRGPLLAGTVGEMLKPVAGNYGLGFTIDGESTARVFQHGGRDEGFDALLAGTFETGQAAAIMINLNDNTGAVNDILAAVAQEYHWPGNLTSRLQPMRILGISIIVLAAGIEAIYLARRRRRVRSPAP